MVINTLYSDPGVIKKACEIYNNQLPKNIRLVNFFQKPVFSLLQQALFKSQFRLKFHPYKYKYHVASLKEIDSFLDGHYFKRIVNQILLIDKHKTTHEIREFKPGNYTLLHDSENEKLGTDFVLDFSKTNKSFGGYTKYLTEREEILQLNPAPNTLCFVERDKEVMKYTKYVQHRQKHPIIQVVGTITKK